MTHLIISCNIDGMCIRSSDWLYAAVITMSFQRSHLTCLQLYWVCLLNALLQCPMFCTSLTSQFYFTTLHLPSLILAVIRTTKKLFTWMSLWQKLIFYSKTLLRSDNGNLPMILLWSEQHRRHHAHRAKKGARLHRNKLSPSWIYTCLMCIWKLYSSKEGLATLFAFWPLPCVEDLHFIWLAGSILRIMTSHSRNFVISCGEFIPLLMCSLAWGNLTISLVPSSWLVAMRPPIRRSTDGNTLVEESAIKKHMQLLYCLFRQHLYIPTYLCNDCIIL